MISRWIGGAAGLLLATAAFGQSLGAGFLTPDRPSDLAPSTRVGLVARSGGPQVAARGSSSPAGGRLPAFRGFGTGYDPDRTAFARAFRPSLARRFVPGVRPGSLVNGNEGVASMQDYYIVSALDRATAMDVPIMGWEPPGLPLEQGRIYIPPTDAGPFHQFFGLTPEREITAPLTDSKLSAADHMGIVTQGYVDDLMERARVAFKTGTTPGLKGREEYLSRALDLCDVVSDLDRKRGEATLLHLQGALAMRRSDRAAYDLYELTARDPEIFKTRPDFAAYFGDTQTFLDAALRDYIQLVELSKPEAEASLIQAYCAWALNDPDRMRRALTQADRLNRAGKFDEKVDETLRVMRFALTTESAAAAAPKSQVLPDKR